MQITVNDNLGSVIIHDLVVINGVEYSDVIFYKTYIAQILKPFIGLTDLFEV